MMTKQVEAWLTEQFGGDRETMDMIYGEYLTATADQLEKGRAARAAGDYPLLDRIAHTLKGNALMVGDQLSADAAIALRDASKISDGAAADQALDALAKLDASNRA